MRGDVGGRGCWCGRRRANVAGHRKNAPSGRSFTESTCGTPNDGWPFLPWGRLWGWSKSQMCSSPHNGYPRNCSANDRSPRRNPLWIQSLRKHAVEDGSNLLYLFALRRIVVTKPLRRPGSGAGSPASRQSGRKRRGSDGAEKRGRIPSPLFSSPRSPHLGVSPFLFMREIRGQTADRLMYGWPCALPCAFWPRAF
jgi:hypothetical protein